MSPTAPHTIPAAHAARAARKWLPALALALPALTLALLALQQPADAADAEMKGQIEQKMRLSAQLMSDSPTAQRIAASGNPQAIAHMDAGRVHHVLAVDLFSRGDLVGAGREVDDALRFIGLARRTVLEGPNRIAAARQRYQQLLGSTERLLQAYQSRVGTGGDASDLTAAMGLVANARQSAESSNFDEANRALALAERHLLDGMNRALHSTTLDYTARFATPAEEFQHELARHGGFAELLPVAINDLKPKPEALVLIERYSETSRSLRAQALQKEQAQEHAQALVHIKNATLYLQRALLAAGLVTPQQQESKP